MAIKTFKNKNLLVISPWFPDEHDNKIAGIFVKDQVIALSKYFKEIIVVSPRPYGIDRDIKNYSYNNIRVYYPRFFHLPVSYFRKRYIDNSAKAILNLIQRERIEFDLIHAHFTSAGIIGLKLKDKFNVPVVLTIHENKEWFLRQYQSRDKDIYSTWKNADALIRVNKKDLQILSKFNNAIYYVPNGFDNAKLFHISKIQAREILGLHPNKKILFSLGGLIERKGFHYLIDAVKEISNAHQDILCIIGGRGPLKEHLKNKIKKLSLSENVKLVGQISEREKNLYYNAADLFVLPSLSESFGVVVLEAMAVGTPVVATTNGGSEQIITSEEYGLLVEPANAKDLAEKILIALEREWDKEKIRKYAEQFTWDKVVKRILEVYDNALRNGGSNYVRVG